MDKKGRQASPAVLTAEARRFGVSVGLVLAALGGWWIYRGRFTSVAPVLAVLGALLLLTGLAAPRLLTGLNRAWMAFAEGLSFVMTRLILAIVFFLVVTPIGWVRKALGADPLRRATPTPGSFWHDYSARQRDPRHYKKMY